MIPPAGAGPVTRAVTGPAMVPGLVMVICPVTTVELMANGTVNGTVIPPVAEGSVVVCDWAVPNLRGSAATSPMENCLTVAVGVPSMRTSP